MLPEILGVIMVNTRFPRIIGDVGNPESFGFPVRYKVVDESSVDRVVVEADRTLLPAFIEAAREFEEEGVKAITTSCGFLALFQDELASAVKIPVFTSSLLQVPLVYKMLKSRIGIITANAEALTSAHLRAAGIKHVPIAIGGMEHQKAFSQAILQDSSQLDADRIQGEVIEVAQRILLDYPDIGAFVFECTNLPPYSKAVKEVTGRPVFDILTLAEVVYRAII